MLASALARSLTESSVSVRNLDFAKLMVVLVGATGPKRHGSDEENGREEPLDEEARNRVIRELYGRQQFPCNFVVEMLDCRWGVTLSSRGRDLN